MRGAGGVAGEILGGPAELEQLLLELAASPGLHHVRVIPALLEQQRSDLARARDLAEHGGVGCGEREGTVIRSLDHEATVTADGLGHVDDHRLRDRELGVLLERREHVGRGVAGGARVPQAEARDAVGVDVLGGTLQLGEDGQVVPGILGVGVGDLEQHGAVALHDERTVGGHPSSLRRLAG